MPERYQSAELMAILEEVEAPSNFFTRLFFPAEQFFETQTVEFDIVRRGRRLAPFVAPTVAGRPVKREGFVTKSFKPAYIKPKTYIDVTRPLVRLPGEKWGGSLTPNQRFDRLMAEDIRLHSEMLKNRIEWMAASTIVSDGYIVDGEDYPKASVTFGSSTNLRITLAGAATWDQATSSPLSDIESLALRVRNESFGATARTVIMDNKAWELFRSHKDVKDILNTDYKNIDLAGTALDLGIRNDTIGAWVAGTIAGRFTIIVYDQGYEDENGVTQNYLPDYTVIVAAPAAAEGKVLYGAILDKGANWQAVPQFFKSRSQWDPSGEELLSQSAPLVCPRRINTWGVLTVA